MRVYFRLKRGIVLYFQLLFLVLSGLNKFVQSSVNSLLLDTLTFLGYLGNISIPFLSFLFLQQLAHQFDLFLFLFTLRQQPIFHFIALQSFLLQRLYKTSLTLFEWRI